MDTCTQCGAELGVGRFCTNCGHPVSADEAWRTDTAERPSVPVFADAAVADSEPPRHRGVDGRGGAGWVPWIAGFLVLALIGGAGVWLLVGGDEQPARAQNSRSAATPESSTSAEGTPEPATDPSQSPSPKPEPSRTKKPRPDPAEPTNLVRTATVEAPPAAATSQDTSGQAVSYVATNMLDGNAQTAWRMPGDGTGRSITVRFDSPQVLTRVGLINGYAKVGQDRRGLLDWYAGNRRISRVEWTFGDGTVIAQSLSESASIQTIPIEQVKTRSVTLRLLAVSAPGAGRASRDYTAISDVRLVGRAT